MQTVRQMCKVPVCTEDMDSFGGERDSIQQKSCQLEEQDRGGIGTKQNVNPLGKVPAIRDSDGTTLYESEIINEACLFSFFCNPFFSTTA